MAKSNKTYQQQAALWAKEGRGDGTGPAYKPWLTIRDVSSTGRSHRVFGRVTNRIHHLLSDLELAVLLILDWNSRTRDIREQFPLRLEDTLKLADSACIKHPAKGAEPIFMTSDFLVDTSVPDLPRFALQAKYASDLEDARTVEKLEIERRYWQSKQVPWFIVTEREIPQAVFSNIDWLHTYMGDGDVSTAQDETLDHYVHYFERHPDQTIIEISKELDRAYNLAPGESLAEIRSLMAQRKLLFDITKPYPELTGQDFHSKVSGCGYLELLHVSEE